MCQFSILKGKADQEGYNVCVCAYMNGCALRCGMHVECDRVGSGLCVCMIFSIYVIIAHVNKDLNIDMIETGYIFYCFGCSCYRLCLMESSTCICTTNSYLTHQVAENTKSKKITF